MAGQTCSVNGSGMTYVEVFLMRKWPLEIMRRMWKDNIQRGLRKAGCENKIRLYLCPGCVGIDSAKQGCTNSRCQFAVATEFCTVAPPCRLSVLTFLHVT
jgi:hypothetical protein